MGEIIVDTKRVFDLDHRWRFWAAWMGLAVFMGSPCWAAPLAQSGPLKTSLLEVYSSEGCSSCPPAEEWVSGLLQNPRLWKDFVPVVFHVDYWDYLGWRDALSDGKFSDRQRAEAGFSGSSVYTPGFFLDGREWRDWYGGDAIRRSKKEAGVLTVEQAGKDRYKIVFEPRGNGRSYTVQAALLGFGLVSDVRSGENSGRRLTHDFAVMDFLQAPMLRTGDGHFEKEVVLSAPGGLSPEKVGLSVWVSEEDGLEPLQAAGSFF